jgi:hypothetical protein
VANNGDKRDYPSYRRQGFPITRAPGESVIKQVNRRVKGSEKFWLRGGVEAVLQVRPAVVADRAATGIHPPHRSSVNSSGI